MIDQFSATQFAGFKGLASAGSATVMIPYDHDLLPESDSAEMYFIMYTDVN